MVRARAIAAVALLALPAAIIAQTKASGTIDGVVRDSALRPLDNASAWILGTGVELTTRANGRFRMLDVPAGEYIIVVRKIGYAPFSTVIQVPARDTIRPSFELAKADVSLDTIRVTATAPKFSPMLQEFEERRKIGLGQYVTQETIRMLNHVQLSDYLRTMHSLRVTDSGVPLNARMPGPCPLQWFVDGVLLPNSSSPDLEMPKVNEIYGIEVYTAVGTIPVQYATFGAGNGMSRGGSFCGVVLLWTKRGN